MKGKHFQSTEPKGNTYHDKSYKDKLRKGNLKKRYVLNLKTNIHTSQNKSFHFTSNKDNANDQKGSDGTKY